MSQSTSLAQVRRMSVRDIRHLPLIEIQKHLREADDSITKAKRLKKWLRSALKIQKGNNS